MKLTKNKTVSPLIGGIAGTLLQRVVLGRVMKMGGIQGMLIGAAATYLMNKYLAGRAEPEEAPARR